MAKRRTFTIYDNMEFPDYTYSEYPRALRPPNHAELVTSAREMARKTPMPVDKEARADLTLVLRAKVEAIANFQVIVHTPQQEKAVLEAWAADVELAERQAQESAESHVSDVVANAQSAAEFRIKVENELREKIEAEIRAEIEAEVRAKMNAPMPKAPSLASLGLDLKSA